jgi:hypothetical protein
MVTLRHATALALVGWYLLVPPNTWIIDAKGGAVTVPVWEWNPVGTFGTRAECERSRDSLRSKVSTDHSRHVNELAECLQRSDPILEGGRYLGSSKPD